MADDLNDKKRKKQEKTEKNPKKPRPSSKKKPGFDKEKFKETEYCIKDGLRYVKPYPFTFTTYCKGRWLQRKLLDVLSQEFQAETTEYYRKAIETGNITVNESQAKEELILKDNDIISHKVHRHEPPVTAAPIQIISETEDLVVVNKPSSIPIHPCGRYRHNTLVFLLGREFGFTNLYTIHRIDRLTSGIVMFAKSLEKAQQLEKQLREHELQKEYVCKVRGEFPSDVIDCSEPIAVVSHKIGVCHVHVDGKPSRTVFTRESFDGTNSIVKCHPSTGRMHQIRVHLQWLGYPIIDDPIYNHKAWGLDSGKGSVNDDKAWKVIESITTSLRNNDAGMNSESNSQESLTNFKDGQAPLEERQGVEHVDTCCDDVEPLHKEESSSMTTGSLTKSCNDQVQQTPVAKQSDTCSDQKTSLRDEKPVPDHSMTSEQTTSCTSSTSDIKQDSTVQDETRTRDDWKQTKVPGCTECQIQRRDPTPAELTMCLHAAVYKGPDWEFRCPWPSWALPNMDTQTTN